MKVAKLVKVSLMTRVIVDEDASEEEIIQLSRIKLMLKVQTELGDNIEEIEDDEECPFDAEFEAEGLN